MKSSNLKKNFRVVSRRQAFSGRLVCLEVLQIQTSRNRRYERELIKHPGAVVIIPQRNDGRLILVLQLRVATGKEIWEFPAGTLEKGESPVACAQRELEEETGWKPGRLKKLLEFYPSPGVSTEKIVLFFAGNLKRSNAKKLDIDEELKVRYFSLGTVERMFRQGKIIDGKTILGFLFFRTYLLSSSRRRSSVGRAAVS